MILWIGDYKDQIAIRCLGANGLPSKCLRLLKPYKMVSRVLKHREGTTRRHGTSPSIGAGESKRCRDYGIAGFSVGCTVGDPNKEPVELNGKNCCVLAYDIECEYAGPSKTSLESSILCISLKCTCGFAHIVTRSKILGIDCNQSIACSNRDIVIQAMKLLIGHAPVFTVGHNIYAFDNLVLAKALPKSHLFRSYFQTVQKSDNKASTTIGLIMTVPGINNLDTYKYIFHSMYHSFKQFSLEHLSNVLELPLGKMDSRALHFCRDWYSASFVNRFDMARYNMRDCDATLGLCEKLDIINQVVSLCYGAKAWIRDVMLYNTGAMSLSSMCSIAWNKGYRYNWTRCDWIPNVFSGGQVLFTGEKVKRNVAIVDFTSMYPSLIRDAGVSPECVDFIDMSSRHYSRFDSIRVLYTYSYNTGAGFASIGLVGLGINNPEDGDAMGMVVIAECSRTLLLDIACPGEVILQSVAEFGQEIKDADPTLSALRVDSVWNSHSDLSEHDMEFKWYLDYSMRLCRRCKTHSDSYKYVLSPDTSKFTDGMVDWVVGPLATTVMFVTDEYIARFPPGPRICADACETLMNTRKRYKRLMANTRDRRLRAVYDRTQYALKISANSMYGVMSFRHYNSYSPRCGTSITGSGRWSLNVSAAVVRKLGFELIYGDTDSVMYALDSTSNSNDLVYLYVGYLNRTHVDVEPADVMEFISGNTAALPSSDVHLAPICGIVVKVLNRIMSYTCFVGLSVEQQETNSTTPSAYKSVVFPSFMVTSKKHYVGMRRDGELYTKGMNYIRKSGSRLSSIATEEFARIVLTHTNIDAIKLSLSRACHEYKWKVRSGRYIGILGINMKYMGKKSNYIRVIQSSRNPHKYIEPTYVTMNSKIDVEYYLNNIKVSLRLVTTALGIDFDPIYSGHVMGNGRNLVETT